LRLNADGPPAAAGAVNKRLLSSRRQWVSHRNILRAARVPVAPAGDVRSHSL